MTIAIFRHSPTEGPSYFAEFLDEQKIPFQLIRIDAGDAVPQSAAAYSGLVFMGGPMSVNDDLPWIPPVLDLIRDAVARDVPLLGHCLGGQLMSKALGGVVTRNPVKEIGWHEVTVSDNDVARSWFGDCRSFQSFHWHGETFTLPAGATHLLSSEHCANQAYAIGKHLAMQCHVEMTEKLIDCWCEIGVDEVEESRDSPVVQPVAVMRSQTKNKIIQLNDIARFMYTRWLAGTSVQRVS